MGTLEVMGAANDTLLQYSTTTIPSPLQASPKGGDPALGEIDIVVSNGGDTAIFCESITFTLPVGDDAQDLVSEANASAILYAATPSDRWHIRAGNDPGQFVATPLKPEYQEITADGLLFQLYNIKVNQQVGTFELSVHELGGTSPTEIKLRKGAYQLAKFPYSFRVADFVANKPEVADGEAVTLTWVGSQDAKYTILYASAPPVDVTDVRTWTTPKPPGIHVDTTFILDAQVIVNNETVHHYLSTTVTVANPDLLASTLAVIGASSLNGPATVGTAQQPAQLSVNGPAVLGGTASVQGPLSALAASVSGAAAIGGTLTVSGALKALGAVSMRLLGQPRSLGTGTYTAGSDGFIIGTVSAAGVDYRVKSVGWADAWYGSAYACATGGNMLVWLDPGTFRTDWYAANISNSFLLPIPKGAQYALRWTQGSNIDKPPTCTFIWISLGAEASVEEVTRIGDVEMMPMPSHAAGAHTGSQIRPAG